MRKLRNQSGYSEEFVREKSEYTTYGSWFANAFADRDVRGMTIQDHIWTMQRQLIIDLAKKENCVIIGRCADYILRDEADLLTVFIHAGMQQRAERIVRVYGEREDSPEKRLKDKDKRRRAYYQFYTDMEWGDVCNYQIALDSGALGIETCADLIARLY